MLRPSHASVIAGADFVSDEVNDAITIAFQIAGCYHIILLNVDADMGSGIVWFSKEAVRF